MSADESDRLRTIINEMGAELIAHPEQLDEIERFANAVGQIVTIVHEGVEAITQLADIDPEAVEKIVTSVIERLREIIEREKGERIAAEL